MPMDDSAFRGEASRSRHPTTESTDTKDSAISSGCPSTSSASSESSRISLPPAPDGGWGWVVVFAAFIISLICDGCAYSFGILYSEWVVYFSDTSKSLTAFIGALFVGVPLLLGPIASTLTTQFGCRKVTIAGGFICSAGFILSYFAPSVAVLCVTLGVVSGIGNSFSCVTSMVIVAFYFEKKRALATGLAVCGAGIGTFIFAPLTEYLIDVYGWRGTMLILGGINLNVVVCGMLFRPLKFSPEQKRQRAMEHFERISRTMSRQSLPSRNRSRFTSGAESKTDSLSHSDKEDEEDLPTTELLSHSQIQLPTYIQSKQIEFTSDLLAEHRKLTGHSLEQCLRRHLCKFNFKHNGKFSSPDQQLTLNSEDDVVFVNETVSDQRMYAHPHKKPALENGTIRSHDSGHGIQRGVWQKKSWNRHHDQRMAHSIMMYRSDLFYRGNLLKLPSLPFHSSCPELHRSHVIMEEEETGIYKYCPMLKVSEQLKEIWKTMFDPKVLKNPIFLLFAISNFMLYLWSDVPYMFVADYATELTIPENNVPLIISVMGIINTLGQIVYGFVGDTSINLTVLYSFSCILAGTAVALTPLATQFWSMCVLGGLFGLFISANYSLCTVMLADYLGIEKLTNAYGLIMLIQGVANLCGPPIAAYLRDLSGSYLPTFYAAGALMALSGVFCLCILLTEPRSRCRRYLCCCCPGETIDTSECPSQVIELRDPKTQLVIYERESTV